MVVLIVAIRVIAFALLVALIFDRRARARRRRMGLGTAGRAGRAPGGGLPGGGSRGTFGADLTMTTLSDAPLNDLAVTRDDRDADPPGERFRPS